MDLWWLNSYIYFLFFFAHIHHLPLHKMEGASKMKQPTPSMAACSEQLASGKHSTAAAFDTTIWPWWKGEVNLRWLKPMPERKTYVALSWYLELDDQKCLDNFSAYSSFSWILAGRNNVWNKINGLQRSELMMCQAAAHAHRPEFQ